MAKLTLEMIEKIKELALVPDSRRAQISAELGISNNTVGRVLAGKIGPARGPGGELLNSGWKVRARSTSERAHGIHRDTFGMKKCSSCAKLKALQHFHKKLDGHQSACKPCHRDMVAINKARARKERVQNGFEVRSSE